MLHDGLIFAAVLAASGILLLAATLLLMAMVLLRPERMTDAKANVVLRRLSPADLGLRYQDLHLDVRDEQTGRPLRIAAWWIPADSPDAARTVLLIHGRGDAKVGAIAWAPTLHALGWHILAIDLRAHGESAGKYSTAGYWERHDVAQVINQFRAAHERETATLVIFGVSLGAAVALAAAVAREDIAGLILEAPFGDYRQAVAAHAKMQGHSGEAMRELAVRLAEWISRADFDAVRPQVLMAQLKCPVMVIHGRGDPFIPPEDAAALAESLRSRARPDDVLWTIPEAGHVLGMAAVGPDEYRARVAAFLDKISRELAVSRTVPVAGSGVAGGGSARD